jgi:glyoxylase-like metal-dependent hydrolase (beta-lactamase superfamily II)
MARARICGYLGDWGLNAGDSTAGFPLPAPAPRRGHARTALWIAAGVLLLAVGARALGTRYTVTEIKPHVFVWVPEDIYDLDGDPLFPVAGTAGFIMGSDGVIVINTTNNPFHAREVRYEIRERTDLPVKYVIDTDSRGDHILGNEVFTDEHATIISTPVAAAAMRQYHLDLLKRMNADGEPGFRMRRRMRGIHFTLPTEEIHQEMTIGVGGEEVRLLLPLAGPTAGNLVVYLPRSKVLFLGDLYENGYKPEIEGANLEKWVEFLHKVETWDVDVYVPGHGAPGDKKSLEDFIKVLESAEKASQPQENKSLKQEPPQAPPAEQAPPGEKPPAPW